MLDPGTGTPFRPLGRRIPSSFVHVERYPASVALPKAVESVEKILSLPSWHWNHDQGYEGSCVGHGIAMERAITQRQQNVLLGLLYPTRRYDPISIWNYAKGIDEWGDTNPGDDNGTSVNAGYKTTVLKGARRVDKMELLNGVPKPVNLRNWSLDNGVSTYRWANTIDEMRTAVSRKIPIAIGVNWYSNFDHPVNKGTSAAPQYWVGEGSLGQVRGGHCLCIFGASDAKQAFKLKNSWGRDYPLAWMPYTTMERLLNEYGEMAIVTDR